MRSWLAQEKIRSRAESTALGIGVFPGSLDFSLTVGGFRVSYQFFSSRFVSSTAFY